MVCFYLLGRVDLRDENGRELRNVLAQPKRLALLAYLCLTRRGASARRDTVLALFWPELDQEHARKALNKSVHFLRQALGAEVLQSPSGDEVAIDPTRLWCDATAFESAMNSGDHAAALSLYHGDLLPGVYVEGSPAFDGWRDNERRRLQVIASHAAQLLAKESEERGDLTAAIASSRRALELSDSDERLLRALLAVLDRAGDRAGALKVYETFADRLEEEYQTQPAPETQLLVARIRERVEAIDQAPAMVEHDGHVRHGELSVPPAPQADDRRVRHNRRVRRLVAGALFLGIALAAGVLLMSRQLLAPAVSASPMRFAVFPLDIRGGTESQYLGEAVMDLLSEALDGAGDLRRVHPRTVMRRVRESGSREVDPEHARVLATQLGAGRFMLGTVTAGPESVRVAVSLYDSGDRDPMASSTGQGLQEDLIGIVQVVARDLLAGQTLGAGTRLGDIRGVRASNFAALRAYLQAEALLRRGWFDSAGSKLQQAVRADSTFGLAWYRLAIAQGWGAVGSEGESFARAMQYRDSLSPRDRLLVEGRTAFHRGDVVGSEAIASTMTGRYPNDVEGWHLLGLVRFWYRWQRGISGIEARAALLRALAIDPDYSEAIAHATLSAIQGGLYREADSLMRKYPRGGGAGPFGQSLQTVIAFGSGDSLAQASIMGTLRRVPSWVVFNIAHGLSTSDSLRAAASVWRYLADDSDHTPPARIAAQVHLGYLEMARGRRQAAAAAFAHATRVRPSLAFTSLVWMSIIPIFGVPNAEVAALRDSVRFWRLLAIAPLRDTIIIGHRIPDELGPWSREYYLGLVSAQLGDSIAALRHAEALDRATQPPDDIGLRRDLSLEIRALLAFRAGKFTQVVELLEGARLAVTSARALNTPVYMRPIGRFLRAEALYELGRYEDALGWYDSFGARGWGTEYVYAAPKHLRLGEIYERTGDPQQAIAHYRRFVAKWQDADEQYQPLVRDVRLRMERLRR